MLVPRLVVQVSEALRVSRAVKPLLQSGGGGGGDGDVNVPALLDEVSKGRRRIAELAKERDAAVAGLQEAERRRVVAQVNIRVSVGEKAY
jgi:hypothetical protein